MSTKPIRELARRSLSRKLSEVLANGMIAMIQAGVSEMEIGKYMNAQTKNWRSKYNTRHYRSKIKADAINFSKRIANNEYEKGDKLREKTAIIKYNRKKRGGGGIIEKEPEDDNGDDELGGIGPESVHDELIVSTPYWFLIDNLSTSEVPGRLALDEGLEIFVNIASESWYFDSIEKAILAYPEMRDEFKYLNSADPLNIYVGIGSLSGRKYRVVYNIE